MRQLASALVVALVLAVVQQATSAKRELDYNNPIRSADEDRITNLPGLSDKIGFKQYSGYLSADARVKDSKKFLHYWFVESQRDPANDPLVLWLNGGPGCSSLAGLLTELGPFSVNPDGRTLRINEFSWNKIANVLFLESPAGVGFSYSSSALTLHTDDGTAQENHQALRSFMKKFPQFKNNSLYLTGESYAGVYLPTLGERVDADPEFNLKGIAIGNGYLDAAKLADSLVFFAYHHGIVGKSTWDRVSEHCCSGKPVTRENCVLSGKKSAWSCGFAVAEVAASINSGINPYNLYSHCDSVGPHSTREMVDRSFFTQVTSPYFQTDPKPFHVFKARRESVGVRPPCVSDQNVVEYLNQPEVRKALHVPDNVNSWDICSMIFYIVKYPRQAGGLAPQIKGLIESKRNLRMMIYNGDVDAVCNFLGDEWFVDDLGRKVIRDYSMWRVDNQVAGFVKHYDGVAFVTVRGSGHMVPGDRPREALEMMRVFLNGTGKNFEL